MLMGSAVHTEAVSIVIERLFSGVPDLCSAEICSGLLILIGSLTVIIY